MFLYDYYYLDMETRWLNSIRMKTFVSKICTKPRVSKFTNIYINPVLIRVGGSDSRVFKL